jgi:hypothetical protein
MGKLVKLDRKKARLAISEDKDHIIWVDSERQIVSILSEEGGRMLVLIHEDSDSFGKAINVAEASL